jgi:hypothetical protein
MAFGGTGFLFEEGAPFAPDMIVANDTWEPNNSRGPKKEYERKT